MNNENIVKNKTIQISCPSKHLEEIILPFLKGNVFHVTTLESFEGIKKENKIVNNKDKSFSFSYPQSENSHGRKQGWICLFDLRTVTNEQIDESLLRYYFLNPVSASDSPIFLILSKELYPELIPYTYAQKQQAQDMWIPYVECWYPQDILLKNIKRIIELEVRREKLQSN
ncbi:hypothetical protein KKC91_06420 [bacterium]|nr:hypothetical protein [bacterium]